MWLTNIFWVGYEHETKMFNNPVGLDDHNGWNDSGSGFWAFFTCQHLPASSQEVLANNSGTFGALILLLGGTYGKISVSQFYSNTPFPCFCFNFVFGSVANRNSQWSTSITLITSDVFFHTLSFYQHFRPARSSQYLRSWLYPRLYLL